MKLSGIIALLICGSFILLCIVYAFYKRCQSMITKKKLQESRKDWKLKHRNTLTGNFVMTYHMAVDEMYQFRDQSLLGKGSYGVVVVGVHKESKVEYAIKLVNTETGKRHRIEREYKLLKDIDHPNIVRLFAVYDTPREVGSLIHSATPPHFPDTHLLALSLPSPLPSVWLGELCHGIMHRRSSWKSFDSYCLLWWCHSP
jgi:serine/threonine protein kinase